MLAVLVLSRTLALLAILPQVMSKVTPEGGGLLRRNVYTSVQMRQNFQNMNTGWGSKICTCHKQTNNDLVHSCHIWNLKGLNSHIQG